MSSEDILDLPAPPCDRSIPYGDDPLQFGELRLPAGPGPHPLVIWLHGGFWRAQYDLAHAGHACAALAGDDVATWNIEYRRIGNAGGGWPGTFLDVAAAADHIRHLAADYPLDLRRTIAAGHSAGGHLALWLAARHRIAPESPLFAPDPLPLRGAVSLAGVVDLHQAWELRLRNGIVADLLGGAPDDVPDRYAAASPPELLPLEAPQVLVHGTEDESVPYALSVGYCRQARACGDEVELITLPGAGHFDPIDPRSPWWPETARAVRAATSATSACARRPPWRQ
jgi:acetyl esterase/lipase